MAARTTLQRGSSKTERSPAARHRVAIAPGGPGADALTLQRQAGNAAVVALLQAQRSPTILQRQPAPAPGPQDQMSQDDAEYIATDVQKDFHSFYNALMLANTLPHFTHYRHNLMLQLDAINMDAAIDRGVFTDPLNHMDEITSISEKIHEAQAKLRVQHNYSKALWTWFDAQFEKEKAELGLGAHVEQTALHILTDSYLKAKQRADALGEFSVVEDFVHVVDMLKQKTHLKFGAEQAAREEQQLSTEVDAISREMAEADDDGPGFLAQVWSIVGWESPTDFLKDIFFAVVTFGASKYYKSAKRGKKALDLAKAARGARKLKYLKRLEKLDHIKDAAEKMVRAVANHQAEISSLVRWIRGNARNLARKIATDLASDAATRGVKGGPSVGIGRIKKDYIQVLVDEMLNVSEEQGQKYVELSHIALFAGKEDSHRKMLSAFFSVSLRRRGLTNLIDAVVVKTGNLDVPTDFRAAGIDVADIAISTAREVLNDFLNGLPYIDKYKSYLQAPIETALKIVQKIAQDELPR